ncbi:phage portal protein [Burkholderia pseudomallei]
MPETKGAKVTPLANTGLVSRAAQALRYVFTGQAPGVPANAQTPAPGTAGVEHPVQTVITGINPQNFMGPLNPLPPVAQDQAWGRRYDYPVGYNQRFTPRAGEQFDFDTLRMLADSWDLLRIVIETRKDQLDQLEWQIRYRDESKRPDDRCKAMVQFFENPDRVSTWSDWVRQVLDDLFVIDAPCIQPRFTKGGALYSLEIMDGATIKPLYDVQGRVPMPPDPAFQQIIKGLPVVDYTFDELLYRPRNRRSWKAYGFSPVEQIIMTINTGIRRNVATLQYYTDGSLPDSIVGLPDTWNAEQIRMFQEYWDELLSGNTAERRKTRFMPGAGHYVETREPGLKDEFDEWLARIVCYCLSVEPTPFIKAQNRAVAQTAREQSIAEGQAALKKWLKRLIDGIMAKYMNSPDLEFVWNENDAVDPLQQAQIDQIYLASQVVVPNEVRQSLGMDPLDTPEANAVVQRPGSVTGDGLPTEDQGGPRAARQGADEDNATEKAYNPDQPRDEHGRWTASGASDGRAGSKAGQAGRAAAGTAAVSRTGGSTPGAAKGAVSEPYGRGTGPVRSIDVNGHSVVGQTIEPTPETRAALAAQNASAPTYLKLTNSPASAQAFADAISAAKAASPNGAAVHVYSTDEYQHMQLFLTENGKGGVAVKPDGDIVSVFNTPGSGNAGLTRSALQLAVQHGGNKLDCFDTVLPTLYSQSGFRAVARMSWNDEYAPPGWNKEQFAAFNQGKPDVVFMAHDPGYGKAYAAGDGVRVSEYDAAVRIQSEAAQRVKLKALVAYVQKAAPAKKKY